MPNDPNPHAGQPGGTNALTPTGGSHVGATPEPPTGDEAAAEREDPHRIEGERTKPSPEVAAQRARDEADVSGSTSGVDAGNPK